MKKIITITAIICCLITQQGYVYGLASITQLGTDKEFNEYLQYGNPFDSSNTVDVAKFPIDIDDLESDNFMLLINADDVVSFASETLESIARESNTAEDLLTKLYTEQLSRLAGKIDYFHHKKTAQVPILIAKLIRESIRQEYGHVDMKANIFDLEFLISELIKNAYVHGNKLDLTKSVFIGWAVHNGNLYITVADHGTEISSSIDGKIQFEQETPPDLPIGIKTYKDIVLFNKRYSIAKKLLLTDKNQGLNDLQNDKLFNLKLSSSLIRDVDGKSVGKFVTTTIKFNRGDPKEVTRVTQSSL